eukprot:TRINITY_DN180_c0_g1_i6.p1 TRINITY_DN180_c0_g1~~TRINITY_DN180_c0_g1_i6.p1  ORF type:complete len:623 (+),score=125.99 TRINITY_DN180_c0_g1_i6:44-1870(+)
MKTLGLLMGMATQAAGMISFSDHVNDHMVLQRAPEKSGVFGTLSTTGDASPSVTATVTPASGSPYQVSGRVTGSNWIAYLKPTPAGGSYKISVSCTGCSSTGPNTIEVNDVTFGDVWYCGGQSNMALPLLHTISRNDSVKALQQGQFNNIRLHQLAGNMNPTMLWTTALNMTKNVDKSGIPLLFGFSSTCYYFGQELSRLMGADAPPIGLIHTAWGGSTAEQWTSNKTSSECRNVTLDASSQEWFDTRLTPFSQMTVKGFVWYQGENDMGNVFGNSLYHSGYSCEVPKMVDEWRSVFSQEPGTTDPKAPFGLVTLAPSGTEGHPDIGGMYFAQTASYGDMPNDAFPNTFYAHAFDLGDPFSNITCYSAGCCPNNLKPGAFCHGCDQYCDSLNKTNFYMGPIHPRDKLPVGQRLAQACWGTVYEPGKVAVKGPIISGCSVSNGKLTVNFNKELLGNDHVTVGDYQRHNNASFLQVLTNSSLFCLQTAAGTTRSDTLCRDDGTGKAIMHEGVDSGVFQSLTTWPMVNIDVAGPTSITADVSNLGDIYGIRYAFFNQGYGDCCGLNDPTSDPCPIASCPLKSSSGLPATPFMARVIHGKCECVSPQVCDEN